MRKLYHYEFVNLLGRFYLLRERKPCFFKNPVIALLFASLFAPEEVPAPYHGHSEIIFYLIYAAVGGKRAVRNKKHFLVNQFLLVLGQKDFIILLIYNCLIDNSSLYFPVRVSLSSEVLSVSFLPSGLADCKGSELFFNCSVADVESRMRGNCPYLNLINMRVIASTISFISFLSIICDVSQLFRGINTSVRW